MPALAGLCANVSSVRIFASDPDATVLHMQHQGSYILGQQEIAAAPQNQARHGQQIGISTHCSQCGKRGDCQIRLRTRFYTEGVEGT